MRIFWAFVYFCLVTSFTNVNAAEVTYSSTSDNSSYSDCVTVTFEQIYLTNDGMFVHIDQGFIPIYALYSDENNQYRCDIHNRIDDLVTCKYCGTVYDRLRHRDCPNRACPKML